MNALSALSRRELFYSNILILIFERWAGVPSLRGAKPSHPLVHNLLGIVIAVAK